MKKRQPKTDAPSVAQSVPGGRIVRAKGKCVVCGAEVAPFSKENLCWVCRRLKISAWRESDAQAVAQE